MKTILPTTKLLLTFTLCLLFLFSHQSVFSQCSGNITLSTQTQVNNFTCTSFSGNLTIQDNNDGVDNIVSLDPIWQNGFKNGNVTGNVFVFNCNSLGNLLGLDGIIEIGGDFRINNNPNLTTFGGAPFKLKNVGGFFLFINLPALTNVNALVSLQTVGKALAFQNDCGLTNFTPFNTLSFCPWIEFFGTNHTTVNAPFTGLTKSSRIRLQGNVMTSFTGLSNITSLVADPSQGLVGDILLSGNSKLKAVNISSSINSLGAINVTNNANLSDCCFLAPLIGLNPSQITISGNAFGCASEAQVDAPPTLSACPANITVSTNANQCIGSTSIVSPTATDNCDFDTYRLDFAGGQGTNINDFSISSGQNISFNVELGKNTITYKARDKNNNLTSCTMTVTAEDNQDPTISNIPSDVTIDCDDPFPTIPTPLITDNCDSSPALTATSSLGTGPCGLGEIAEIQEFVWEATDASGNSTSANWKVTRISDFSFSLGQDKNICSGGNYVIDPFISGASYQWSTGATSQAVSVSSSGTYTLTITTNTGCCYSDEIMVNFVSPPDASATGAILDCGATSVQITGSSTTAGVTYSWTGPGGFTSNAQNPTVSSTGDYTLTVTTSEGCTSTATATVTANNDVPDASATGGTLDCATTSIQLMGSSTTSGVTFSWTGPNSFTSSDQNPTVNDAGIYTLTVTGGNGCEATADAEVTIDNTPPDIDLQNGTLNCFFSELEYSVEGSAVWSGPDGFSSTDNSVTLTSSGTYNVTVTGSNSCTSSASFDITEDLTPPNISAEGGVVNCASGQVTLTGSSTTDGATFFWTGPGGYSAGIATPVATTLGIYTLVVTGPNGCTATQDVELTASLDAPQVMVTDGTVDCTITSVELTASSPTENLTYSWLGPDNFSADGPNITTSIPGIYTVTGVNEDGCAGSATTEVVGDLEPPLVVISANNLNCLEGATKFNTTVSENVISFSWTGPNGFVSDEMEPEVTVEGTYELVVTASNGCTNSASQTLVSDVENPDAVATGGMLTCTENTITLMGSTTTVGATFIWTGPSNFVSSILNPTVSLPGIYYFNVTASNGCTAIDSAEVAGDPDLPIVSAEGGTLNCVNEQVMLMGSTQSEGATIKWEGPNGFASSNLNPVVDIPGTYTFTVTSTGNCVAFTSVDIVLDRRDPDLTIAEGFIDCDEGIREFTVLTNSASNTFNWEGPDGFTSTEINPIYSKAGSYMVTVTGTNGCTTNGSINVEFDVDFESELIITGNDVSVLITGGTPPFTVTFDNNIIALEVVDLPDGDHFVEIEDGLGCTETIEFNINTTSVLDDDEEYDVEVYPNPVLSEVNIQWKGTSLNAQKLTIINARGQIQSSYSVAGQMNHIENVHDLPSGLYYVKIEGKKSLVFTKFLKM